MAFFLLHIFPSRLRTFSEASALFRMYKSEGPISKTREAPPIEGRGCGDLYGNLLPLAFPTLSRVFEHAATNVGPLGRRGGEPWYATPPRKIPLAGTALWLGFGWLAPRLA